MEVESEGQMEITSCIYTDIFNKDGFRGILLLREH